MNLVTNLRGRVEADDICVKDLQINATAVTNLLPQLGEWHLGYNGKRKLTIEQVTTLESMQSIIDPS